MSENLHPGLHPDPDSLSAFIEGALPEHERLQCLAHLAECSQCREVVFLAQEPQPAPAASNPAPAWRRWFAPVPVLAAAAAACIAALGVSLYLHQTAGVPAHDVVAGLRQAPPLPTPPSADIRPEGQVPSSDTPKAQPRTNPGSDRPARHPATEANSVGVAHPAPIRPAAGSTVSATAPTAIPPSLPPPPTIPTQSNTAQNQLPPALLSSIPLPAGSPSIEIKDDRASADGLSGVSGTITDPSGAAIPGAAITLRQLAGMLSRDARTDVAGQFKVAGLPAGRYELQIAAPGFRQTSKQIELRPLELAAVRSALEIGSVSESVEVTAEASVLQTSASMARSEPRRKAVSPPEPRPLPSKLPAAITVTSSKVMLAVDSDGSLFLSRNAGKGWKAVKPAWAGKVVHLIVLAEPSQTPTSVFQLTTDSDSAWLSRDGNHWYPASARR
jgi:hypothetical protein